LKRYELTESGKELLAEQERIRLKFREEMGFMPGQFFDSFLTKIPQEKLNEIRSSMKYFANTMFQLGISLRNKYSEVALNDALRVIVETSKSLEEINEKLKAEK
jgi:DNA-binding PadR family transcriptional regulator